MTRGAKTAVAVAAVLAVSIGVTLWTLDADAADHSDPPSISGDPADIADTYAWHDGENLVVILTMLGGQLPALNQSGAYDADVLYTVHIDNDGDATTSEIDVHIRFGQDSGGNWGMQVENLPGTAEALSGAVETELSAAGDARAFAGLREDPFFFDLTGFMETFDMGTLRFDSTRDFFAGRNATVITLEMPLADALDGGDALSIWTEAGRIGGGL